MAMSVSPTQCPDRDLKIYPNQIIPWDSGPFAQAYDVIAWRWCWHFNCNTTNFFCTLKRKYDYVFCSDREMFKTNKTYGQSKLLK